MATLYTPLPHWISRPLNRVGAYIKWNGPLRQKNVAAICVGPDCSSRDIEDVKHGKYTLIFASPEALLRTHKDIFRSNLKYRIGAIFVDESHCIAKW